MTAPKAKAANPAAPKATPAKGTPRLAHGPWSLYVAQGKGGLWRYTIRRDGKYHAGSWTPGYRTEKEALTDGTFVFHAVSQRKERDAELAGLRKFKEEAKAGHEAKLGELVQAHRDAILAKDAEIAGLERKLLNAENGRRNLVNERDKARTEATTATASKRLILRVAGVLVGILGAALVFSMNS